MDPTLVLGIQVLILGFQAMIPLALCAMGEVLAERAGVVNIGLEGILLTSAFMAVVGAHFLHDPWLGLAVGTLTGLIIGLIHGVIGIYLKGDQIVSGVAINLFALGFVAFGLMAVWGVSGAFSLDVDLRLGGWNIVVPTGDVEKPLDFLGKISYLLPFTFGMAIFIWWLLHKTTFGLRIKAIGENPESADVAGVRVERTRMIAVLFGAALGGLAGAYLSVDWVGAITKEISAGRGFIALATVVFSKLNPLLTLVGAFTFGLFDTLGVWLSTNAYANRTGLNYFIRMIPYVVTLIVVAGLIGRARFPKATAQPYRRE
jgi:simple sugar transport system permease protein